MAAYPVHYPNLHHVSDLDSATIQDLQLIIQTFPIIDNHAHNLLTEDNAFGGSEYPFESITSEAQGHALLDHVHTALPHIRGVKQLAQFYQCPETLQDVKAARYEWIRRDYLALIKRCLQGTHAILMDDGLSPDIIHPYKWHRQFVPTVSRIVRIEAIAADLLEHLAHAAGFMRVGLDADWHISQTESFLVRFNTVFRNQIRTLANDPDVRGFKSVVCYRTGLDVSLDSRNNFRPQQSLTESVLLKSFHDFLQHAVRDHKYRIEQKEVNDYLVVAVCDVLEKLIDTDGENVPFQFHTGLGDTDINLVKSNPALMQPLIEAFPNVDFILLHSAYPYTREAGYLASSYSNAWLDIGEVFPMLSRDGEESVLRQALELTPSSKILWSTDGHFYPETYWLANKQFREALERLLTVYVAANDMTVAQAIDLAVDILFWNSNSLYKLDEERRFPELLHACGRASDESLRTLVNGGSKTPSFHSNVSTAVTVAGPSELRPSASLLPLQGTSSTLALRPGIVTGPTAHSTHTLSAQSVSIFDAFMQANPTLKYVWLQFLDYTGTLRNRMVTVAQFRKQLAANNHSYVTSALTRLLQDDHPATGCSSTGQFFLQPDLSTLRLNKGLSSPSATVQTWWLADTNHPPATEPYDRCPRSTLQYQANILRADFSINILMGFEIEVVFMRPVYNEDGSDFVDFKPLHLNHSWTNLSFQQLDALPMVEEIVESLGELDIHLPVFHAESAPGQWEFALPAVEPVKAVDDLFKAKDVIRNIAKKHGLKATLYPRPFADTCGSACHAHFSINGPPETLSRFEDSFLAGVLEHLPSILAFTLPIEESYARIGAGIWAGGEYVCWGSQNKEVPLRKCGPGHYELKTIDGIGNSYLGMAALLAAGIHGLRSELQLAHKDCLGDPTQIGPEARAELGITTKLPVSLELSLKALDRDKVLRRALGYALVDDYLAVAESLREKLTEFGDEKRRVWLMSRY
ncbi:hypothetical protein B0A52_06204 [Exophiala mesophila]|uniref:GS catalytic domain-containing protein n=1 Tax=Exophiala mesophila TaxID=212818 RepID=A0A438N2X1_EXOME|nr:hypothetical protein B0A52_06204 [Exophiala mesophila]